MSVIITPSEQLEFQRPLTRTSKESLFVKNASAVPVIFKVKTTSPKQYSVRPNAGLIEPNSEIEVQILLQAFKEEPSEDFKCKDKFLIQTAPIDDSMDLSDFTGLWSVIETQAKEKMSQYKIKCVFVSSQNQSSTPAPVEMPDPSPKSSIEETTPVARQFQSTGDQEEKSVQTVPFKENNTSSELNIAHETIKSLQQQIEALSTQKLQARSNDNSTNEKQASFDNNNNNNNKTRTLITKDASQIGFPPQVVLGVAILVFILTYLFF